MANVREIKGRRMSINALFVVPTLKRAGAETQVIDLINGLDNQKFSKFVVVFGENVDQLDRLDTTNTKFFHIPQKSKFDFSIASRIAQIIDQYNIDVIHGTIQISLLVAWLALRQAKSKPKLTVAIHTTSNVSIKNELIDRTLYRFLFRSSDSMIFVCQSQARYWGKKFPEIVARSVVLYNGVDPDKFDRSLVKPDGNTLRESLNIPEVATVIACIAGFRPEKGHENLLKVFSTLSVDTILLLAGDGPCRKAIEYQAQKLNISARVKFLGNLDDVRPVLRISDFSVLASTAVETFSIAMLESLAMEVPVIATDIGGMKEAILPGKTGDLVRAGSETELTKKLSYYVVNKNELISMGKKGRQMVEEKFSLHQMICKTSAHLEGLVRT
ncbi:MAG: hypothetical protein CMO98_11160 [Woeseia sp.]|nr:hypothetical protein [Woeseia sp.]